MPPWGQFAVEQGTLDFQSRASPHQAPSRQAQLHGALVIHPGAQSPFMHSSIHSITHSSVRYLLSVTDVPGVALGLEDMSVRTLLNIALWSSKNW